MTPDKRGLSRSHGAGKNPQEKFSSRRGCSMQNVWVLASLWFVALFFAKVISKMGDCFPR
jgi:hypothetical protein